MQNGKNASAAAHVWRLVPRGARKALVSLADADEIIAEAAKHQLFYRNSGGGITFSGGEATAQPELLEYLSSRLYDMGFSLDIESCGYFEFERVRSSLERMDLIFMDLKHMDSALHEKFTGVPNERILENIKQLAELSARVVIRIPTIEGVNADEENIRKSGEFVKKYLPRAEMELLPYHKFGFGKYEALGIDLPDAAFGTPQKKNGASEGDFAGNRHFSCGLQINKRNRHPVTGGRTFLTGCLFLSVFALYMIVFVFL